MKLQCEHIKQKNGTKRCVDGNRRKLGAGLVDDSLTSLQWLTGVNIVNMLKEKTEQGEPPSPVSSTTSEDSDDKRCATKCARYYPGDSARQRPTPVLKPPYSYASLIIMAMKSKVDCKITLREIYNWISDNFAFYRNAEAAWQNSIRHNLSLNKCFAKIPRQKGDPGRGGYWTIAPHVSDKLVDNNICKRNSPVYDYKRNSIYKGHRVKNSDISKLQCGGVDALETRLICQIKNEIKQDRGEEKSLSKTLLDKIKLSVLNQHSPVDILFDVENCLADHAYGKSPIANCQVSEEESIRAIAPVEETGCNMRDILPNDSIFSSISSAIRTDCIWSVEQNDYTIRDSESEITNDLFEDLNVGCTDGTLNHDFYSEYSNPLLSDNDARYIDNSIELDENRTKLDCEDIEYLSVRGKRMTLFQPSIDILESLSDYDITEDLL